MDSKGGGVTQRCPLNPLLFNILLEDFEEMGRVKWGRVKLGEGRVYPTVR